MYAIRSYYGNRYLYAFLFSSDTPAFDQSGRTTENIYFRMINKLKSESIRIDLYLVANPKSFQDRGITNPLENHTAIIRWLNVRITERISSTPSW